MLHKPFARSFTPAVPGVEPVPGGQYCYSAPSAGSWEMQTQYVKLYPVNGRVETPPGTIGTNVVYLPNGQIDYVVATVVTSVWVPAGDSGAPRCVSYPAIEGRAAVPARTSLQPVVGWDAGANSVQSYDGACEAVWTMGAVVGVYVGFTATLEGVHDPLRYSHAFYFHQVAGRPVFRLREAGADVSGDALYQPEDEFRIRRVGGKAEYFRNGSLLHTSITPSDGEIYLGTSLYASGDSVPSAQVELPTPPGSVRLMGVVPPDYVSAPFVLPPGTYTVNESATGASCDWEITLGVASVVSGVEGSTRELVVPSSAEYVLTVLAYAGGGPFDILISEAL